MSNNNYVEPPKSQGFKKVLKEIKGSYKYLHPDYWKRKLVHLIIVVPAVFFIDATILGLLLQDFFSGISFYGRGFLYYITGVLFIIVIGGLTLLSAYFYPFSLYWYKESLIGRLLNNIVHFGSFFAVIGKILATLVGGVIIAGVMAPIMGLLTLRKCKKKNLIIGDASDFN